MSEASCSSSPRVPSVEMRTFQTSLSYMTGGCISFRQFPSMLPRGFRKREASVVPCFAVCSWFNQGTAPLMHCRDISVGVRRPPTENPSHSTFSVLPICCGYVCSIWLPLDYRRQSPYRTVTDMMFHSPGTRIGWYQQHTTKHSQWLRHHEQTVGILASDAKSVPVVIADRLQALSYLSGPFAGYQPSRQIQKVQQLRDDNNGG